MSCWINPTVVGSVYLVLCGVRMLQESLWTSVLFSFKTVSSAISQKACRRCWQCFSSFKCGLIWVVPHLTPSLGMTPWTHGMLPREVASNKGWWGQGISEFFVGHNSSTNPRGYTFFIENSCSNMWHILGKFTLY